MTIHRSLLALLASASLGLSACGGGDAETNEPAASDTSGDDSLTDVAVNPEPMEVADPTPAAWAVHIPDLDDPNLTVRVEGPSPAGDPTVGAVPFQTRVLITNTGTEAAEIEQAHVAFDVWKEDGTRHACTRQGSPGEAPRIDPGEAHELLATAVCDLPTEGEYEIRTYVSFDAESDDEGLMIERYYAGRHELTVR